MTQNETARLQAILAEVFEFSSADIKANRQGMLTGAQRERITRKHYVNSRTAWTIFAIIFGLGFLGFSAAMIQSGDMGTQAVLMYLGVTVFFGLIVEGYILFYRYQLKRTLRDGNVKAVQGKIRLIRERAEKTTNWYFGVDKYRFRIEQYQHRVLLQESGVVGREAIMYVSTPWRGLMSVVLQE